MVGQIIAALRQSALVTSLDVLELIEEENVQFVKARADLVDGSVLYVRELIATTASKYAYQWQRADGTMRLRWDNAPHHRHISTHPDHKHVDRDVLPSFRVSVEDVLEEIGAALNVTT